MKDLFNALKRLGWFFKENIWRYLLCLLSLIYVSVMPVIPTKILGLAIDDVVSGTITSTRIIIYIIGIFVVPVTIYLVNIYYHYNINALGQKLSFKLREKYLIHLFEMDSSVFEQYSKGDLIARITNDLDSVTSLATGFLQNVVYYIALIAASLFMMITINPLLTLCAVAFMPIAIFILNAIRKKKRKYYKIHHEIYGKMTENVIESIECVKTVRAYGIEEIDFAKTKKAIDDDTNSWWYIQQFESIFTPMFELVYALSYFISIGLGSYFVIKSLISPGSLVSFLLYDGMLYTPLVGLSNLLNEISNITVSDARFYEVLNIKPTVENVKDPKHVLNFKEIEFRNVSFKYPNDNFTAIENINLTIESGTTIGIVGPTGAGKSTLIRQLLREFNITSGDIYIDGVGIENFEIGDVRDLVGYVPQEHILFRKSVDENVLVGNPTASLNDIHKAFDVADFTKDLKNLPFGEETLVSESGNSLSGGQRQRLSIARAVLKNPEILILDDSLSAVDALTETKIIQQLMETRNNKTNIIVAHSFSALAKADMIYVMENGHITHQGTHRDLLSYDNWYKEQYLRQIRGDHYE